MYGYSYPPPAWLVMVALLLAALPTSAVFGLAAARLFAIVTRDRSENGER